MTTDELLEQIKKEREAVLGTLLRGYFTYTQRASCPIKYRAAQILAERANFELNQPPSKFNMLQDNNAEPSLTITWGGMDAVHVYLRSGIYTAVAGDISSPDFIAIHRHLTKVITEILL